MTRKHFVALAAAIADLPENPTKRDVINAIACVCKQFNWAFNWAKFEEACNE